MTPRLSVVVGSGALIAAIVLGMWVVTFADGTPTAVDEAWHNAMVSIRTEPMIAIARVLNTVGGGWVAVLVVPILLLVMLLVMRRYQQTLFAAVTFIVSAGLVQALKHLFGRVRPDDMLVVSDFGSFPSGHAANAATLACVLIVVFPRLWVVVLGVVWTLSMMVSRTILAVHWLTDTVGGALLGIGATLLIAALFARWTGDDPRSIGWGRTGTPRRRGTAHPSPESPFQE